MSLTLAEKAARLRHRAARIAGHGVRTLEVASGAAIGGLVQGLSKSADGPHILKVPAELALGLGLHVAGFLELAGNEWSSHLNNFGDGFLGAYFSDLAFSIGRRKRDSGKWSLRGGSAAGLSAPAVQGEISPQQMAQALAQHMGG